MTRFPLATSFARCGISQHSQQVMLGHLYRLSVSMHLHASCLGCMKDGRELSLCRKQIFWLAHFAANLSLILSILWCFCNGLVFSLPCRYAALVWGLGKKEVGP